MKKKVLCTFLAVCMAVGALSGCGNSRRAQSTEKQEVSYKMDPILNEPGKFPIVKEKYKDTELKIGIAQNTLITDYEDNTFTKALEKKLGCNITFELLPSADTAQKVELMIAAGGQDLPDVLMMNFADGQLAAYGANGTIVDLKPYYENSAYYLNDMFDYEMDKYGDDIKKMITLSDGSMYYVPKYNKALQNEFAAKCWIYQPWLDKLGLKKPTTLSAYKKVLQAFKTQDPNGNGKADEIPLGGYKTDYMVTYFLASFVPIQTYQDYMYADKNGKIHAAYMEDEWKAGLKYLNGLYKEGLLDDTKFTNDNSQFTQLKSTNDIRLGSFVDWNPSHKGAAELEKRTQEYIHLAPLKNGKDGVSRAASFPSAPSCGMVVTKNCEHPELAFRLGDLMCSEEMTIWNRWGEKGVDWTEPTEDEHGMFEDMGYKATITPVLVWGTQTNHHWNNIGPGYRDYYVSLGQTASASNASELAIAKAMPDYIKAEYPYIVKKYIYDVDKFGDVSRYKSEVRTYVDEQMSLFITGNKDIDKDWDEYISHLKTLGAEEYLKLTQEGYDKYVK